MKYEIGEQQLEKIVFKYLDNREFSQIKRGDHIYFVNSEGDEYAQLKYDKDIPWIGVSNKLYNEVSSFFNLDNNTTGKFITRWIKVSFPHKPTQFVFQSYLKDEVPILKVPY